MHHYARMHDLLQNPCIYARMHEPTVARSRRLQVWAPGASQTPGSWWLTNSWFLVVHKPPGSWWFAKPPGLSWWFGSWWLLVLRKQTHRKGGQGRVFQTSRPKRLTNPPVFTNREKAVMRPSEASLVSACKPSPLPWDGVALPAPTGSASSPMRGRSDAFRARSKYIYSIYMLIVNM